MGQGSFSSNVENEPFCCKAAEKTLMSRALVTDFPRPNYMVYE